MDHPPPPLKTREPDADPVQTAPEERQSAGNPRNRGLDYLDDLRDRLQGPGAIFNGSSTANNPLRRPRMPWGLPFSVGGAREYTHRLVANHSKPKVHTVGGTFFQSCQAFFQRYAAEHPALAKASPQCALQRQVEKLSVRVKKPNGQNVWACKVIGPLRTGSLNGYLLHERSCISEQLPEDNKIFKI